MSAGYEAKFVQPLLKRHECPICLFAMKNPVQTECGHLFCRGCLEPVLKRRRPICPLDKVDISLEGIFPDNACRREILNLEVYCNHMTGGCNWIGQLKQLEEHCESCEYRDAQCTQCGQYVQQLSLKQHQDGECPMRPEPCEYCKSEVPLQQMQAHLDRVCDDYPHTCPNSCDPKLQMKRIELEKHIAIKGGSCPLSEIECPFRVFGCTFVSLRKNVGVHLDQYRLYHTQIQAESVAEVKLVVEKTSVSNQHLLERVGSVETRLNAVERLQDALEQRVELIDDRRDRNNGGDQRYGGRIENLEEQNVRMVSSVAQLQEKVDALTAAMTTNGIGAGGGGGGGGGGNGGSTAGGGAGFRVYAGGMGTGTASSGYGTGPDSGYSSGAVSQKLDSLQGRVTEVERSVDRALSSCLDQELRIQLIERVSYNGVLLWKIDEFDRRRKEAIDGITLSLYSTPFYTSRHSYKMCARIYLNGDGLGKGTHLSFFFVMMRGPFDALLPWPFKQKVTLTLLNQAGKKHVTDSFRPDPHSSSFARPGRREMNVASGCPMFIRLEHLQTGGFVKDDSIYVRVIVDAADIPKAIP